MEIDARNRLGALYLSVAIGCAASPVHSGGTPRKAIKMQPKAEHIWNIITNSSLLEESVVLDCRQTNGCFKEIAHQWQTAPMDIRKSSLSRFSEIGGLWQQPWGEEPGRFGPYLVEESLIQALVEALSNPDSELRGAACGLLARDTPDSLVRDHAPRILSAVKAFPGTAGATLVLGRLGSDQALKTLRGLEGRLADDPSDRSAAFGKLGDSKSEDLIIDAYLKATDPRVKKRFAWYLGYMGTPKSLKTLASDLRNPYSYGWNQKAQRSFRIHVIAALSVAYPFEYRLWTPVFKPSDDSYYQMVENWAESILGASWSVPRPSFLYEEEVPMARPAGH